jgi:hypothetical protein
MQLDPRQLEQSGVTLPILVQLTVGIALVDMGSRTSLIDISFARELDIQEHGEHEITGITGPGKFPRFSTEIEIPWLETKIPAPVGGAPLRESGIPWHALIGRDVTRQFEVQVDGVTGLVRFLKEAISEES